MKLKKARIEDFELIFEILHENAKWLEQRAIVQWPLDWLESKRDEIKSSIEQGSFYNVEGEAAAHNEVAAIVELKSSPEDIWKSDDAKVLYIHKLAIRRKYENQGLGRQVLRLIKERAIKSNMKYLRLDCVAHNLALRQYYEANGFKLTTEVDTPDVALALYELAINP